MREKRIFYHLGWAYAQTERRLEGGRTMGAAEGGVPVGF